MSAAALKCASRIAHPSVSGLPSNRSPPVLGEALAPNLVVFGALWAIAVVSPKRGGIARATFVAIAIAALLRYLWWRWTDTLLDQWWTVQGLYIWAMFLFELLVSADLVLG